jgi:hypothetical protein
MSRDGAPMTQHLSNSSRRREGGYAYLMALFMVLVVLIGSEVAMQNIVTQGRREREAEMMWRGQQFIRAIRLYYRKTGHYPQNIAELKKGMPQLNFLRYSAYRDPMKSDDEGTWRFIYVNAAGQIIGSVKYATLQQMAIMDLNGGKIPGLKQGDQSDQPGVPASSLADQSNSNSANQTNQSNQPNAPNSVGPNGQPLAPTAPPSGTAPDTSANASLQNAASPQPNQNATTPTPTNNPGTAVAAGGLNTNMNAQSLAALAALKPTGPVDGPVIGGFLTGVSSTVDKPSIRIYNGGKKYNQWEFIWNPVEDQAKAVQQGIGSPVVLPGQPGQAIGAGAAGTNALGNPGAGAPGSNSPNPNPGLPQNPQQPGPLPQ